MLLYADDMVVFNYNVFDMQAKSDVSRKLLLENDLKANLNKTKIVIFRVGKSKLRKPQVFLGDEKIEIGRSTYLGVPMNGNMSSYNHISDHFVQKGTQAQRVL
jgi:hypothetical protein